MRSRASLLLWLLRLPLLLWPGAGATLPLLRRDASPFKSYSGLRARADSLRQVYLHDQTVAVVELAPGQRLLSCEFIEVYKPEEVAITLASLRNVSQYMAMTFDDMVNLMTECDRLNSPLDATAPPAREDERGSRTFSPFSLLSGIMPGTKWCGVGDLAENYHDLGQEAGADKCCRAHDICPVKVRGRDTRYNLTNTSIFTKSHCKCERRLFSCLKAAGERAANSIGTVYFNILRVQCVEDMDTGSCRDSSCIPARRFRRLHMHF